ncbi:MAG: M20/M25/M40 family metallo-hydrolase [Elusimicrobia bacterium]|nr:M20/M25/M40 family metallo-hydrolase [Elusimicrobiota bacterium]
MATKLEPGKKAAKAAAQNLNVKGLVKKDRMVRNFLDMVQINSLSRKEGRLARFVMEQLSSLGVAAAVDDSASRTNSDTGNVIAYLPASSAASGKPSFLLSAHMDTVAPGEGIRPIVESDRITSDGSTILGGDCKSGIAVILEVLTAIVENNLPHGDIEVCLTVCEEIGLLGSKYIEASKIKSKFGLVLDSPNAHALVIQAPAGDNVEATIFGLEAHAGVCPEKGVSAIQIASHAIDQMRLGRVDRETTANIGSIQGGMAVNIVPSKVVIKGEARSLSLAKLDAQTKHMRSCLEKAARKFKGDVAFNIQRGYMPVNLSPASQLAKWVRQSAQDLKEPLVFATSGGASDANNFSMHGMQCANLGTGVRDIHTLREWLHLKDFLFSAQLTLNLLCKL